MSAKEKIKGFWNTRLRWILLSAIIDLIIIVCYAHYVEPFLPYLPMWLLDLQTWLQGEFKIGDLTILAFLAILTVIMYEKLNDVSANLREIGRGLGDGSVEIGSLGSVYPDCRWAVLSRTETDGGRHVRDIYVSCSHPEKPITAQGCPENCRRFEDQPQPSGSGAFGGMVIGGLVGLMVGGPVGVILFGLIGGGLGHASEAASLAPKVSSEIRSCQALKLKWQIHVEDC